MHKKRTRKAQQARKNELKFEYYICRTTFEEKNQLRDHLGIHAGEIRHNCDMCNRKLIFRSALNRHKG